jgi:predicted molibdopterin-dependent oxidoreductase YjgC
MSVVRLHDDLNRRIVEHPILGAIEKREEIDITLDGRVVKAFDGEPIAAALLAAGVTTFRRTTKTGEPRGYFCGIGLCTDCMMVVDGRPNVRTCITPVRKGMNVETQVGLGHG